MRGSGCGAPGRGRCYAVGARDKAARATRRTWASPREAALRAAPGDAQAHAYLGAVRERLGERDAARRHYAEALRLSPTLPEPRDGLERLGSGP